MFTAVYIPRFTKDEYWGDDSDLWVYDEAFRDMVVSGNGKEWRTVYAGDMAQMGGSVRCMSWQLYQDQHIAEVSG